MTARQWLRRHRWLPLWAPVLLWMGIIFVLSAQPDIPHPAAGWLDLLASSLAHAFLFGVLALLYARALGGRPRVWFISLVLALLYALSDELHQGFVPGRQPDVLDIVCDMVGAALALGLWHRSRRRNDT